MESGPTRVRTFYMGTVLLCSALCPPRLSRALHAFCHCAGIWFVTTCGTLLSRLLGCLSSETGPFHIKKSFSAFHDIDIFEECRSQLLRRFILGLGLSDVSLSVFRSCVPGGNIIKVTLCTSQITPSRGKGCFLSQGDAEFSLGQAVCSLHCVVTVFTPALIRDLWGD